MTNITKIKLSATVISLLLLSTVYATPAFADSTVLQKKTTAEKKYQDAVQNAVFDLAKNKKNANGDTKKIADAYNKYNIAVSKAKADYENFKKSLKPVISTNKNTKMYASALDKVNKEYNMAINVAVEKFNSAFDAAQKKYDKSISYAESLEKDNAKQTYKEEITYAKAVFNYAIQKIKSDYSNQVISIKTTK